MPAAMRLLRYRCAWLGDTPARCATAESGTGSPQAASAARRWRPVSTDWMPRRCAAGRPVARAGPTLDRGILSESDNRLDPVLDSFVVPMSSMSVAQPESGVVAHKISDCTGSCDPECVQSCHPVGIAWIIDIQCAALDATN